MSTRAKARPADAPRTFAELEEENTVLHQRLSHYEQEFTRLAVEKGHLERTAHAAGARTAHTQLAHRAAQYWALALAEVGKPLEGLIHRAKTLGPKPTREKIDALAANAVHVQGLLPAAHKAATAAQEPLVAMTADRDRLREHILTTGRAIHATQGRPYTSRTGRCDCAGCDLIVGMDTPTSERPTGPVQPTLPGMEQMVPAPRGEQQEEASDAAAADNPTDLPDGYTQPTLPGF